MTSLPFEYNDFHGGLNTRDSPFLLTDDQARDLLNVQGTTAGAIVKRDGVALSDTFATEVPKSVFVYQTGAFQQFIIGAGGSLYKESFGGHTAIKTGLTDSNWEWVQSQPVGAAGPLYGMNGVDAPQMWDGVAASTSAWTATTGTVPNGKYMIQAGNRLWVTGVAASPSRVYFSDLIPGNNGPVTWPTANVAIFDENDGDPITGIGKVGPYILVTKARKLYVITDMNTGDGRRLSETVGCARHRTIVAAPEGTFFLSDDRGVYMTNGSTLKPMSDQILPTLAFASGNDPSAVYYKGHYYLATVFAEGVANNFIYDYDTVLGSWWVHSISAHQFALADLGSPGGASLFCVAPDGLGGGTFAQCFTPGVTTDYGTPFTWRWRGPWQSPTFYRRRRYPTPYFKKRWRQIRFEGTGTVDVSIATDFSGGEVLWQADAFAAVSTSFGGTGTFGDSSPFGDSGSIGQGRIFSIGVHNAISVVFSATSATADSVYEYTMMVSDRKDMVTS